MLLVRFIPIILLLTLVSWVVMKVLNRPMSLGKLLLIWGVVVLGILAAFYGISIWVANLNNF